MADAEQPLLRRLLTSISGTLTAMQEVTLAAGSNITITPTRSGNRHTITIASTGGGGGGAPTSSQYVTLATDATLTAERVLTAGHGLDLVDAGAGSTVTLDVDETELTHASLGDRAWTSSGHTGTASRIAAFDGGGAASYLQVGVDVQAYDAGLASLTGIDTGAGQPYTTAANTYALATVWTPLPYTTETWTRTGQHGRMVDLLAADIADVKASPPTGWAWSTTANTTSADIASGVLTITAASAGSYNTPTGDNYLYHQGYSSDRWRCVCHMKCTADESFEGGYFRLRFSDSTSGWIRIGPVSSSGDVDAYDGSAAQTPVAMTAGDWFWLLIEFSGNVLTWYIQTNGTTDSALPTTIGTSYTTSFVYAGTYIMSRSTGTTQPRIGLGILRAGAPSGSWTLVANYFRIYYE